MKGLVVWISVSAHISKGLTVNVCLTFKFIKKDDIYFYSLSAFYFSEAISLPQNYVSTLKLLTLEFLFFHSAYARYERIKMRCAMLRDAILTQAIIQSS